MLPRLIKSWKSNSFFLLGPRGTGKSTWIKLAFPKVAVVDLLDDDVFTELNFQPTAIRKYYPKDPNQFLVIDEIQKIPELLDEVHRTIEQEKRKFILTGSSARKLRKSGSNLLAGRAYQAFCFPLTVEEFGKEFNLDRALQYGTLPKAWFDSDPDAFMNSYIAVYLREEILQEGLVRKLTSFSRFLVAASFSHGQFLNTSSVSREAQVERKLIESYFEILDDLMIGVRLPIFSKRAKRELSTHCKFFYFDCGVYRRLRPKGPLDSPEYIAGSALEGFVLQDLRAMNHYLDWRYDFYSWRTSSQVEVDLVLYGVLGLHALEIKHSSRIRTEDLNGLRVFKKDYPSAKVYFLYRGSERKKIDDIEVWPVEEFLLNQRNLLGFIL